ncbi:MAG: glycosyltransferase family 4 protein [Gilvibacter sp.]
MQNDLNPHNKEAVSGKKRRILIVSNTYPSAQKKYSGIFVKNQYEELLKQSAGQEQIDIFYMERSITGAFMSIVKYLLLFFRFIPYLFKKYKVVHLHFFIPLIAMVWFYKLLRPKTKLIITFHGGDVIKQFRKRNEWLFKPMAKKVDLAIPVGKHVASLVEKKLDITNIMVLPVGVDNRVFFPEAEAKKIYDFIFVGSFFHVKGIDILFDTICKLPKTTRFCIVGKGAAYEPKFAALIDQGYDIVIKIDQSHEQLRSLYNQAKFLVLPSRSEGFPTVTIEAMYCGTPVITSDIPQFKEQVNEGQNGFMFATENAAELFSLLEKTIQLSEERYLSMSGHARESFPELRLDIVCAKILNEYRC